MKKFKEFMQGVSKIEGAKLRLTNYLVNNGFTDLKRPYSDSNNIYVIKKVPAQHILKVLEEMEKIVDKDSVYFTGNNNEMYIRNFRSKMLSISLNAILNVTMDVNIYPYIDEKLKLYILMTIKLKNGHSEML